MEIEPPVESLGLPAEREREREIEHDPRNNLRLFRNPFSLDLNHNS